MAFTLIPRTCDRNDPKALAECARQAISEMEKLCAKPQNSPDYFERVGRLKNLTAACCNRMATIAVQRGDARPKRKESDKPE